MPVLIATDDTDCRRHIPRSNVITSTDERQIPIAAAGPTLPRSVGAGLLQQTADRLRCAGGLIIMVATRDKPGCRP